MRPNLLAWQWSDYAAKHRHPVNLLLHVPAVFLFQIGTIILVAGVVGRALGAVIVGVGCMGI